MKDLIPWEAGCLVEKAYQDPTGKMHVVAVASDNLTDLQSDCMSQAALNKMAEDANKGVPLLDNHKSTFEFGRSIKGAVVTKDVEGKPVQQFVVDLELDAEWPHARALYKEIKNQKCQKQLSIGGKLNLKNPNAISVEMTEKGLVRKINDLELDHIACTRNQHAANPRTGFVSAIMKSLDDEKAFEGVTPIQQVAKSDAQVDSSVNIDTKEEETTQPAAIDEAAKDIETGAGILQTIGRLFRNKNGGKDMSKAKVNKGSDETTTDSSDTSMDTQQKVDAMLASASPGVGEVAPEKAEELAPEIASDDSSSDSTSSDSSDSSTSSGSTTASTDTSSTSTGTTSDEEVDELGVGDLGDVTPAEEEAARVLMAARAKREQLRKENEEKGECEEDIVREIAILLSKHNRCGAGTRVDKEVLRGALWNVRYLLAKNIMEKISKEVAGGKAESGAAEAMAKLITDGGAYAPTTESAAKGEKVAGDKQGADVDMGKNAVTDVRKQPDYAAEEEKKQKEGAPTAKESAAAINAAVAVTEKLPKMDETAEYGKSQPSVVDLEKSMNSAVEKAVEATGKMLLQVTEKLAKAQSEQFAQISARIEKIEKAGGVSQSAPRGAADAVVQKSRQGQKPVWGGMFGSAPAKAMSKF